MIYWILSSTFMIVIFYCLLRAWQGCGFGYWEWSERLETIFKRQNSSTKPMFGGTPYLLGPSYQELPKLGVVGRGSV